KAPLPGGSSFPPPARPPGFTPKLTAGLGSPGVSGRPARGAGSSRGADRPPPDLPEAPYEPFCYRPPPVPRAEVAGLGAVRPAPGPVARPASRPVPGRATGIGRTPRLAPRMTPRAEAPRGRQGLPRPLPPPTRTAVPFQEGGGRRSGADRGA